MGFEAHNEQTHAKFAGAFERELLKVLESRPANAQKSDVMLQVPYIAPPFERQAPSEFPSSITTSVLPQL